MSGSQRYLGRDGLAQIKRSNGTGKMPSSLAAKNGSARRSGLQRRVRVGPGLEDGRPSPDRAFRKRRYKRALDRMKFDAGSLAICKECDCQLGAGRAAAVVRLLMPPVLVRRKAPASYSVCVLGLFVTSA